MYDIDIVITVFIIFGSNIIVFIITYNEINDDLNVFEILVSFIIALTILILIILGFVHIANKPTALDVYRNKTELQINGYYQDSTFITKDSTVIFK